MRLSGVEVNGLAPVLEVLGSRLGPATIRLALLGSNLGQVNCLVTLPLQSSQLQETGVLQKGVFGLDRFNVFAVNWLSALDQAKCMTTAS